MACTAEQKGTLKDIANLPKGTEVLYKGTDVPGADDKTNNMIVDGTQTMIEGKDVKYAEYTKTDERSFMSKFHIAGIVGLIFPPAMLMIGGNNFTTNKEKMEAADKDYLKNFFREEVKDQFSEAFNSQYQASQAEEKNMTERIDHDTQRISALESRINSLPSGDPQRAALQIEVDRLKVGLEGDGKESGLIQERDELREDLGKMEVAIEEIKNASTEYGYPSAETLVLFNKHASYTDDKGVFHPGELYKDIEGAQGYMAELFSRYNSKDAPNSSDINTLINNMDSLKAGPEQLGVIGLNVTNMDKAETFVNLMECMPNDCNPREVMQGSSLLSEARESNSALSNINFDAFTTDPKYSDAAQAFNERFAAAEDRMQQLQDKADNNRSHKGNNHNSNNNNSNPTNNPHNPNNPNNPFHPHNGGV